MSPFSVGTDPDPQGGGPSDPHLGAVTDVVLVLDRMGRVRSAFATGLDGGLEHVARTILARTPQAAVGQYFPDLLQPERRDTVARALSVLRVGDRLAPLSVRFDGVDGLGPAVLLMGARLPSQDGDFHLSLVHLTGHVGGWTRLLAQRDPESALLDREAFLARAALHVVGARLAAQPHRLTLIELTGLERVRRYLSVENGRILANEIGACLQAFSLGGDMAGQVPRDRLMLIHAASIHAAEIEYALRRVLETANPDGPKPDLRVLTLDLVAPDLSDVDALQALAETLDRFASVHGLAPMPGSLNEAFAAVMDEGRRQVSVFGRYVLPTDFSMVFQPVVDLHTGEIKHYEALSRFNDGSQTGQMVGYAEQVGMVEEFDLAVVGKVLWMLADAPADTPPVAINLSGRSLQSRGFTSALMIALEACRVPAHRVLFEITETADIERLSEVNRALQELRQRGYRVCLDDFGAGAAAFPYLRELHVDAVKIDGAYIDRLLESPRDQAIVRAIVSLCQGLDMAVVAERVESAAQQQMLCALGVTLGQGYLFGRPSTQLKA